MHQIIDQFAVYTATEPDARHRLRLLQLLRQAPDAAVSHQLAQQRQPYIYATGQGTFTDSAGGELIGGIRARKAISDVTTVL